MMRTRREWGPTADPVSAGRRSASASQLLIHHNALTTSPTRDTAARCGLVSAVPSAATRKLLGTRKISVTLTRSGSVGLLMGYMLLRRRTVIIPVGITREAIAIFGTIPRESTRRLPCYAARPVGISAARVMPTG